MYYNVIISFIGFIWSTGTSHSSLVAAATAGKRHPQAETNATKNNHFNQTNTVQIGDNAKIRVPLFHQREQTCYNRSRNCPEWAELAECRKKNAKVYMRDNCPLSCNLCNPLLEPWLPRDSDGRDLNRMTFESQRWKDFQIFKGVPQKYDIWRQSPLTTEDDREYSKSRFEDVILSQAIYLDEYYRDIQYVKNGILVSASSIDVDDIYIPHGTELPLAETCINRHPYCAQWAIQGLCDWQPQRMKDICAPMCHLCDTIELNGSKVSVLEDLNYHSSPFHRNDLFGIMDAIREDRVVIDWTTNLSRQVPTIKKTFNGVEFTILDTLQIQKQVVTQKRNKRMMQQLQNVMHSHHETGISRQQVIVMHNFATPDICLAILDTVKFGVGFNLAGVDTKNIGDDGFPESTVDYRTDLNTDDAALEEDTIRPKSSVVFLYPTIKYGNTSQFAPSLERLIENVALLIGIPVANIEMPLLLEKFTVGGFRKETSHFRTNFMKNDWNVEKDSEHSNNTFYQDYNINDSPIISNRNIREKESFSVMENARVFGFTLFLNDVKEGGSIYFPNLSNLRVEPRLGKAVLFPTVVSLNGSWDSQAQPLDANVRYTRPQDESFLVEDQITLLEHEKVIQGTKYAITIYFTRFEDETHR